MIKWYCYLYSWSDIIYYNKQLKLNLQNLMGSWPHTIFYSQDECLLRKVRLSQYKQPESLQFCVKKSEFRSLMLGPFYESIVCTKMRFFKPVIWKVKLDCFQHQNLVCKQVTPQNLRQIGWKWKNTLTFKFISRGRIVLGLFMEIPSGKRRHRFTSWKGQGGMDYMPIRRDKAKM